MSCLMTVSVILSFQRCAQLKVTISKVHQRVETQFVKRNAKITNKSNKIHAEKELRRGA